MRQFEELVRDLYGKYAPDQDVDKKLQYISENDYGVDEFVKDFYGKYAPEENIEEKQQYIFKNYFPDQYEKAVKSGQDKYENDLADSSSIIASTADLKKSTEQLTWIEEIPGIGKNTFTDALGDIGRAALSGWYGGDSVDESFDLFNHGDKMTDQQVADLVAAGRNMEKYGQTDEQINFSKQYEKNKEEYGGVGGFFMSWIQNPEVMVQHSTTSMVQMASSLWDSEEVRGTAAAVSGAGSLAGAGAGAALTAWAGPGAIFGAGAGAIGGSIGGFFGGLSGAMETGMTTAQLIQESALDNGLDWATMNDEERFDWIKTATSDKEVYEDIRSKAIARGIAIGTIDGLVGAVSLGAGKAVTGGLAKTALSGVARTGGVAAVAGLETVGGMASEYFGQKAAGQDFNLEEIMVEGFADKTFTAISLGKSLTTGAPSYKLNGQKLNGKEFNDALKMMDDEAYTNADIDIQNSPGVQKLVDNRNENISIDQELTSKIADPKDRADVIKLEKEKKLYEGKKAESSKRKLAKIKDQINTIEDKYENAKVDVSIENRKKGIALAADTKFERNFNKNLKSVQEFADAKDLNIDVNDTADSYFQKISDETGIPLDKVKNDAKFSGGVFIGKGKILINKQRAKQVGDVTVATHEVLHPVLNSLIGGVAAQNKIVNSFKKKLNYKQRKIIENALGDQPSATEYLTVFTDNFKAINAQKNITQSVSDFFKDLFVKAGFENINFDSGSGIYNFLNEYSKSTQEGGKLSDRATKAINKAEVKADVKIGDVGTAGSVIQKSQTSKQAQDVNDIYDKTANKTEAGFNIALKYRGMAENTFKSIRDGNSYTQDQIDKLNQNKDDIISMMLYDKIPSQKQDSKARNVLGLVNDFVKEKQKYGNPAAYINTFFKNRSKEVVNYFVPDAVVESMNDNEGNIKTSVAKQEYKTSTKDQGPAARALTDFNDLTIDDEKFVTSKMFIKIKNKVVDNVSLFLSKNDLDISKMTGIIETEIANMVKAAQGKISKTEGKLVVSKEYNNFVKKGYIGGVKSLPLRVIKDSYLNKLFPTKKLGEVDMQNKKKDNSKLKKDSNYRITKLQIQKPSVDAWIKFFTEGGYTTLLAKQKKYAVEISKAISLKATREILTDPVALASIVEKSKLRNNQITKVAVEGYMNSLVETLDTKSNESAMFDELQFSKSKKKLTAKELELHKQGFKNDIITALGLQDQAQKDFLETLTPKRQRLIKENFIEPGISEENVAYIGETMNLLQQSNETLQRIGSIRSKGKTNTDVLSTMVDNLKILAKEINSEVFDAIGIDFLGVHYRGINWSAAKQKDFISKHRNLIETGEAKVLFDKINFDHIEMMVSGTKFYNDVTIKAMSFSTAKEGKAHLDKSKLAITNAAKANKALALYLEYKLNNTKGLNPGYLFEMGQLQTNIANGFRALSSPGHFFLIDGKQLNINKNTGKIKNPPTKNKTIKGKQVPKSKEQYNKELKAYYDGWKDTVLWDKALKYAKFKKPKLKGNSLLKEVVALLTPKNEHLGANSLTMAKMVATAITKSLSPKSNTFSDHITMWAPKFVCDLIDDAGSKVNRSGVSRIMLLDDNLRKFVYDAQNGTQSQNVIIKDGITEVYADPSNQIGDFSKTTKQPRISFDKANWTNPDGTWLTSKEMLDKANQQARDLQFSKRNNSEMFNDIIEDTKGTESYKIYSTAGAKAKGFKIGRYEFFLPPSAEDFTGLLYKFLGKGKVGEAHMEFFKEKLLRPFAMAMAEIDRLKQLVSDDYRQLKKDLPSVKKMLGERAYKEYTYDSAIRVYLWTLDGKKIPGLSKIDQQALVKLVRDDANLKDYAHSLSTIARLKDSWTNPSEHWLGGNIPSDLDDVSRKVNRKELLATWIKNKNEIFSTQNLNKIEALYGSQFRESLENILARMESGSNRSIGPQNRLVNSFMDWVNNSVGAIMFFNARSAVLQTISAVNFINFGDNNIVAAAKAFANQKQFWSDFTMLFNSDFLKQRRSGLKTDINEAELANAVGNSDNKAKAAFKYMLKKGFLPTQIADSFAIAIGGSSFIRNRINSLIKKGMTRQEAMDQAMLDFREIAEESQQSSRPDRISMQQAGPLGRVILAFANTPMQYNRMMKKAILDLKNRRGDWKTNVSKVLYYGAAQNFIFNALQNALFALAWDEDDEIDKDEKAINIGNGMADSILRGAGVAGAGVATVKNMILEIIKQNKKDRPDYVNVAIQSSTLSPPISSKLKKLVSAARTFQWNMDEIKEEGLSLDNPANLAVGKTVSAFTNIPLDRLVKKIDNLRTATDEETEAWQSIALSLGWDQWSLGMDPYQKKNKKSKSPEKRKIRSKSSQVKIKTNSKKRKIRK